MVYIMIYLIYLSCLSEVCNGWLVACFGVAGFVGWLAGWFVGVLAKAGH